MRKLIVSNLISVDGCFTGAGGHVMAMPFAAAFSEYNAERLRTAGTLLLGRTSFEGFRDYWPPVADDESQPDLEREISRRNNAIEKIVVSDSLTAEDCGPWPSEIVPRAAAHERVAALKAADGEDILVFGSRVLWNDLLAAGLVDELHLMVGPGIVGDGVRAFEAVGATPLRLESAAPIHGGEVALLVYAPA